MSSFASDKSFTGSIPKLYENLLVPLIFNGYAADLAQRLRVRSVRRVLEIAAGTWVVTRAMASALPASTAIIATDLNRAMLDEAASRGTSRAVEWRQADAMQLPFEEGEFDAVVCQCGAMFFPDKPKAFSEVRRVLEPGGVFVFNVWDRIAENEFADVITNALATVFPQDPPRFLVRTPHGYFDRAAIAQDLLAGGFAATPEIVTVEGRSRASSAEIPAVAYCQGTPLRGEIEGRGADRLEEVTNIVTRAIAERFGSGPVDAKIQALVITVPA